MTAALPREPRPSEAPVHSAQLQGGKTHTPHHAQLPRHALACAGRRQSRTWQNTFERFTNKHLFCDSPLIKTYPFLAK